MTTSSEHGHRQSLAAKLLLRAGNPLDWSPTERLLLCCYAVLPFTFWWGVLEYWALTHPDFAPYLDRSFLPIAFRVQVVLVVGWLALAVAALGFRARPRQPSALPLIAILFYFLGFGAVSYYVGHYTNPYGAVVGLAGAIVVALFFGLRPALAGVGTFLTIVVGTTVAEQMGVLPYGPMFVNSVFDTEPLVRDYLLVGAVPIIAVFAAGLVLSYYAIDRWHDREDKLAQANEIISRYVASQLVARIKSGDYEAVSRQHRRKLTLFFSDIEDFAATADLTEPEDLAAILNEYLLEMTEIARRYGATIDKFVGDAIMSFFGAPEATNDRDHALRAVQMALTMQERMTVLQDKWLREGFDRPFRIRIGINTGQASIGNFGSPERMDYTAIGRQVNLAARLQAQCEPGKVLISHSTWVLVQDEVKCAPKGEIQVKGFHQPVKVYETAPLSSAGA